MSITATSAQSLRWKPALIAVGVLFLLTVLMMGVQLSIEETKLVVKLAAQEQLNVIAAGAVLVFFYQLFRDSIDLGWRKLKQASPHHGASLPAAANNPSVKKALITFGIARFIYLAFYCLPWSC